MTFFKFNFLSCTGLSVVVMYKSRFTVGPLMVTIFPNMKFHINYSVIFLKREDGRLTKTTK